VPRMLGLAVVQINQVVNVVLASFLAVGSLGYLNVAWLLIMSPLVLAMAVSTAVFPTLAAESALQRLGEVRRLFLLSLRLIVFLTVPASIGLIVLGEPIIRLFFERGEFGPDSTRLTAFALKFYALGLLGHAIVEIVDRVFYAFHDTWTPVRVAVVAIATNLLLSLILMRTALNYGGLALANALAALLEGGVLILLLSRRMRRDDVEGLGLATLVDDLLRIAAAAVGLGLVVILTRDHLLGAIESYGALEHTVALLLCVSVGALSYLLFATLLRIDEVRTIRQLLKRR
jgi:putative peptidoglycan lipid II flippase